MRIGGINDMLKTYNQKKVYNNSTVNEVGKKRDEMKVSGEAQMFSKILQAAKKAPEVREEKVNSLKNQIEKGDYQVSGDKVADRMLNEFYFERKS